MKSDWSADLKVKKSIHFKRAIRKENLQEISYQFCPEIISRVQNRLFHQQTTLLYLRSDQLANIWPKSVTLANLAQFQTLPYSWTI